jgi:hypothetical protein
MAKATLQSIERELNSLAKESEIVSGSLLVAIRILTETVGSLQSTLRDRLPVWGDSSAEPKKPESVH